ncbi:SDR family oxidoreductase [Mesonia ostreae]|uniref:SDR family oxidoreductase n=1 Tax=Mesonia ostreae TaxID=861110 RepID=A0ABU2KHN4_9FLAO|nr:SDR family oxidoreductase [Mesonia ostreae]MDT0294223.1 SDR family oxidoreductase [Mesonia ostreae]
MHIQNKIAIVTGASSGLGRAFSKSLIEKGALVYGLARTEKVLQELKQDLKEKFIPVVLDISEEKKVEEWVTTTFSKENIPQILVNNAGLGSFHKIEETSFKEWSGMINSNLNGMFLITAAIVKLMKTTAEVKHIVNIGSVLGKVGRPESVAYCTTKFGVQGFSAALLKELREDHIKVTCLNPGSIATDFFKTSGIEAHQNMLQPKYLAHTLMHILETPDNMLIDEITVRPLNPKKPEEE